MNPRLEFELAVFDAPKYAPTFARLMFSGFFEHPC